MPEDAAPVGWRRRHPVLARAVLYGLGAVLVGVTVALLLGRKATDRADREQYLAQRLDSFDLVFRVGAPDAPGSPGGWQTVLQGLDEEFSSPDLPAHLRFRALRWRGVAYVQGGNLAAAEEAFARALDLATNPVERGAVFVEWGEARAHLGEPAAAIALLDHAEVRSTELLRTLGDLVRAYALERAGQREKALDGLRAAVTRAAADAKEPTLWVGSRSWTPADVTEAATLSLQRLGADSVQAR
jgi:tetratricopeptide (TPR) repeat protein